MAHEPGEHGGRVTGAGGDDQHLVAGAEFPAEALDLALGGRARLVAAIARGRRWLDEITIGAVKDSDQLAKREQCTVRQINLTLSLAFLAPSLVKAAVEGHIPYLEPMLDGLRDAGLIGTDPPTSIGWTGAKIRLVAKFGNIQQALRFSLHDLAESTADTLSVQPYFGRPLSLPEPLDVFVLMPFGADLADAVRDDRNDGADRRPARLTATAAS